MDFRGASAEAVDALTGDLTGSATAATGESLFAVARVLREDAALRRFAADPSVAAEARQGLVRSLFDGKVDATALNVLVSAAGKRWRSSGDLADAVERLSEVATISAAGDHRALVDELFGLRRTIETTPELRDALSDPGRSVQDRAGLIDTVFGGDVSAAALALAKQALAGTYGTVGAALAAYRELAAQLNGEAVATVSVARPLSPDHESRLGAALARIYGRPVHLNIVVDDHVLGGVKVEIGDDVIDGTIATRLDDAGRRLAG